MNVLDEIKNLAIKRNNLVLYTKDNALKVVDFLEQKKITIFGFDTFVIIEKETRPCMEFSPDYSNYKSDKGIYSLVKEDILKAFDNNRDFVFELVYKGY